MDIKQTNFLAQASLKFNEGLLVATSGLGNNVYYVDAANYFEFGHGNTDRLRFER